MIVPGMARSFDERFPKRNRAVFRTLARNVKRLRAERDLKQDELAAILGGAPAPISLVENCRANLTLETLDDLATALGVRVKDLVDPQARSRKKKA
jgi:transcriptional regulator with XRE-family HTH domain